MIVTILYEDSLAPGAREFGLHELLLSCLVDREAPPGEQFHARLRHYRGRLAGVPRNGASKVLADLTTNQRRFMAGGGAVVALLDRDKIHREFPKSTRCMTGYRREIARRLGAETLPARTDVVFLHDNTEDVLRALHGHRSVLSLDDGLFSAAIERKELTARDRIFKESAAWHRGAVRAALLADEKMASFHRLVHRVAALVQP